MEDHAQGRDRCNQRLLFGWWNLALHCWDGTPRHWLDDAGLIHWNQLRNLSERIRARWTIYSAYPNRDSESGGGAFDSLWSVRVWLVRNFLWLERFAALGLVHPRL